MKKLYSVITSIGLSVLAISASGQSLNVTTPIKAHAVKAIMPNHFIKKATGATSYAFLDYPYSDSVAAVKAGDSYMGNPGIGLLYTFEMNADYTAGDTGAKASNTLLIHSCSVSFDSLLDATSGTGTPQSAVTNIKVDSIFIPIGQQNLSGKNDTLVIQITNLGVSGTPGTTVLWSDTIIQDTGLSGKGKRWLYNTLLTFSPQLTVSAGTFGITVTYRDASKLDTAGFLYGAPTYTCTTPANALPDTTKIGAKVYTKLTANSFTNGYSYYTVSTHNGPSIELPSTTFGAGGLGYSCTTPANTSALPFQDIAMYAKVTINPVPTGLANAIDNTFNVAQNFPNPFNKSTEISYSLSKSSNVEFSVYDMTGRKIVENSYSNMSAGQHIITLGANQFTPGVYFYTVKVNGNAVTKKMVITQ